MVKRACSISALLLQLNARLSVVSHRSLSHTYANCVPLQVRCRNYVRSMSRNSSVFIVRAKAGRGICEVFATGVDLPGVLSYGGRKLLLDSHLALSVAFRMLLDDATAC